MVLTSPASADFNGQFPGKGSRADWTTAGDLNNLAIAKKRTGNLSQAETLYRRAARVYPYDASFQYNLAQCLLLQEKYMDAEKAFHKSISLQQHFANWNGLGIALTAQSDFSAARQAFDHAKLLIQSPSDRQKLTKNIAELNRRISKSPKKNVE
jgi:tetratricopeptide (TPR) repeat protein